MDIGHEASEAILRETEKDLQSIYRQAHAETLKKLTDYLNRFAYKDQIKLTQLKRGEITMDEYTYWRRGQICIGQRWEEMVSVLSRDFTHANEIAASTINGHLPEAYAINHNYATFQIEHDSLINTSYTLYNRYTVEKLVRDDPHVLPFKAEVNIPKDQRWNHVQINRAVTQSVLQGENVRALSKRLEKTVGPAYSVKDIKDANKKTANEITKELAHKNKVAATRNARTAITSAQNAGRIDSYYRAAKMGIEVEKEWLATLDGRTRDSHAWIDGEVVPLDHEFSNGCEYPGDPAGEPEEVYNCRCTMVPHLKHVDQSDAPRNSKLGDMSYEEWQEEHRKPEYMVQIPKLQSQIGRSTSVNEINDIMNSQGWWRSEKVSGPIRWVEGKIEYGPDQSIPFKEANLTGCDLESAKSIASSYQRMFDRYPQLVGKLDGPNAQPVDMGDNTYAWCFIRNGGRVEVNPKWYNDWNHIVKQYENDVSIGWHPMGTTAESTVVHELGHAIDGLLAREGVLGGVTANGEYRYASSSLKQTIMNRVAKKDERIAEAMNMWPWDKKRSTTYAIETNVSQYATDSPKEWFAECFAEYITSANPRTIAAEFGKELEKLLEKIK